MELVEHIVCRQIGSHCYGLNVSVLNFRESAHLQDLAEITRILAEAIEEVQQKEAEIGSFLQVVPSDVNVGL